MRPNDSMTDTSVDDDLEIMNLEKLLSEADKREQEANKNAASTSKKAAPQAANEGDDEIMQLEQLLCEADKKEEEAAKENATSAAKPKVPVLREDPTFAEAFSYEVPTLKEFVSERTEELDSSDDEEVKNFLERKYNEYGSDINKKLKQQREAQHDKKVTREIQASIAADAKAASSSSVCHIKNPHTPKQRQALAASTSFRQKPAEPQPKPVTPAASASSPAIFSDPVFGLRIINPLISSSLLVERMGGRKAVPFSGIAFHTERGDLSKDWVIAGVIVSKNPVRMTKKGDPYSVWRLSDLRGEIKCCSLFLFKSAHKELWKTAAGMCLAVLNPTVFDKRAESGDVACLSIDTPQKVMILGQSKDYGVCRAKKKNGDPCTSTVNLSECDYCIFHMKQEFGKMSRRSELQSATAGRGLNDLRNKVLGKSEVFYGGQSYSAVPAKKSAKLISKDNNRLSGLSEYAISPFAGDVNHVSQPKLARPAVPYAARDGPVSKAAANVEVCRKQRLKDLERLKVLQAEHTRAKENSQKASIEAPSSPLSANASTPMKPSAAAAPAPSFSSPSLPEKFKNRNFSFDKSPQLSRDNFCIEVNVGSRKAQAAKLKAMQVLKQKPIEKVDPNSTRGSATGKRRAIDDLNDKFMSASAKKQRLDEDAAEAEKKSRIARIMNAASSHTNLINMREREEQEKYFSKLEKKEALEEKMASTYKMPCKAVICQMCKYTAFSAAEKCKQENHPLKVVDAEKRFFQCKDCGNRTVTVFKLPKTSCKTCKGSKWERSGMIRERKVCTTSEGLSIRGDEETFIGSFAGGANLNLLVPEEGV